MNLALQVIPQESSRSGSPERELSLVREALRIEGLSIEKESTELLAFILAPSEKDFRDLALQLRSRFNSLDLHADPILLPLDQARTPKRLALFDMDSTLIQAEVMDEYARELGLYEKVSEITASAMRGEIDFKESFQRRLALLKGLSETQAHGIWDRIQLTEGAEALFQGLRAAGIWTGLVTGGFRHIAEKLQRRLGMDHILCNQMQFENGRCTGAVLPPIVDAEAKVLEMKRLSRALGIGVHEVLAVGDGANDIPLLLQAGTGIAVHAKPKVIEAVGNTLSGSLEPLLRLIRFPL